MLTNSKYIYSSNVTTWAAIMTGNDCSWNEWIFLKKSNFLVYKTPKDVSRTVRRRNIFLQNVDESRMWHLRLQKKTSRIRQPKG